MTDYITHEPIFRELEAKFPMKSWNEEDIYRWCQQVETIYIADPDTMYKYLEIPLDVVKGKVRLPDNLYKLIDVYWIRDYDPQRAKLYQVENRVDYLKMNTVLKHLKMGSKRFEEDVVWINYIGTPMGDDCIPLIYEPHYPACETFCKIQGFEGDILHGTINSSLYMDWKQRFDGMIQGVKGDFRHWGSKEFGEMMIITGNEIPRIGYQPLAQKYVGNGIT